MLGAKHPDTIMSIEKQVMMKKVQSLLNENKVLELQVMAQPTGPAALDFKATVTTMGAIASRCTTSGQWDVAKRLGIRLMDLRGRVLGLKPSHPDMLVIMANLAMVYKYLDELDKAEKLGVQVMETCAEVYGPEHDKTLTTMSNVALTYQKMGQLEKTEDLANASTQFSPEATWAGTLGYAARDEQSRFYKAEAGST